MPALDGVSIATAAVGIKYRNRTDLCLFVFDRPVPMAGVFTRSACASAPVEWCRANRGRACRAVVVNSGNANAFTGARGEAACRITAEAAAAALDGDPREVALASTGVIGEPLDAGAFADRLGSLARHAAPDGWWDAAGAITTTDTHPKAATAAFEAAGRTCRINGIAKGSGMIAPDMATMLAFVATDASVAGEDLQRLLDRGARHFNAITVDSDTSTSDTVLLFATGEREPLADDDLASFAQALDRVLFDLAQQIVRDGEGATKHVEVRVEGATSDGSADRIARSVANSPLVKTAIAGEDANWGRVVMAVGKAGEPADRDRLSIRFASRNGSVLVARDGERDPDYSEDDAARVMTADSITIAVDIGLGNGEATVWTCDLTKAYVAINGDYRS